MVARGDCTIYVAGDRGRADACRAVFDAIAKKTVYVGALGTATVAKLATNLLVGLNTAALADPVLIRHAAEHSPLRRPITPEEVAEATLFLCSPWAAAVTGQILYVDCGYNVMGV